MLSWLSRFARTTTYLCVVLNCIENPSCLAVYTLFAVPILWLHLFCRVKKVCLFIHLLLFIYLLLSFRRSDVTSYQLTVFTCLRLGQCRLQAVPLFTSWQVIAQFYRITLDRVAKLTTGIPRLAYLSNRNCPSNRIQILPPFQRWNCTARM